MCPFHGFGDVWKNLDQHSWSIVALLVTALSILVVFVYNYLSKKEEELRTELRGQFGTKVNAQTKPHVDADKASAESLDPDEFVDVDKPDWHERRTSHSSEDSEENLPDIDEKTGEVNKTTVSKSVRFNPEVDEKDEEAMKDILTGRTGQRLHGALQTADLRMKAKKMEQKMSLEEKEDEANARKEQLEAIFSLMKSQEEKFGIQSEDDFASQMKLYSF